MKYSDWKLLTNDEKQQVKFIHRPHIKAATLYSGLFLLLMLAVIYAVLKNRTLHVNRKPTAGEAYNAAEHFVRARLRMPATADFPAKGYTEKADEANSSYIINGTVKTQNINGKTVSLAWNIILNYTGGDWADENSWTVKNLKITPEQ